MIQRAVVSEYISTNFGTSEDFLFEKHPSFGVFRHPISGKWFGVLMEIPRSKVYVSEADDEDIVILNVKINCQGQLKIVGFRQDKNVGFRQ